MNEQKPSGVQELINRLSDEGVAEGQRQADLIIAEARRRAEEIVDNARREAKGIVDDARDEADKFQAAGEEALQLAARDAVRDFGTRVHESMRRRLQELVHHELKQPALVKQMILEITRSASESVGDEAIILLPPDVATEEETRKRLEQGETDALTEFVQGLIGEDLREGFTIQLGRPNQDGMTVRVVDRNVELDLTEQTITELLARHLLPRYRAVMRRAK